MNRPFPENYADESIKAHAESEAAKIPNLGEPYPPETTDDLPGWACWVGVILAI